MLSFFPKQPDRISRPPSLPYDGYRRPLLGLKRPGHEIGHSLPSSVKVKNEWSHISSTLICLPIVGMDFSFSSLLEFKASHWGKMLFETVRCVFYYLCLEASPGKSELLQNQYELNKKF